MLGSCNALTDYNRRCDRTFDLSNLIFRDPFHPSTLETADLCKFHYNGIVGELNEHIDEYKRKIKNLKFQISTYKQAQKQNDTYYDTNLIQSKIDDIRTLIKNQLLNECKNIFCRQNLRQLERYSRLYSVHTFRPNGRRHYTFYFCSVKCFNIMKGKCGFSSPIIRGQTTLNI